MGAQLGLVIREISYAKWLRVTHEAVPLGRVAGDQTIDFKRYDFPVEETEDPVQRPHPAQGARTPPHRFRPRKAAHELVDNFGNDFRRFTTRNDS